MDKSTKYYRKALTKYHKGYIDEAISLCGQSVAENNKFKAATSLKGVLFYFKGDLENARELWDFNVRMNKDVVSQKYIENTRCDDEFLNIFARAVTFIKEVRINEALELLQECEKSDFNVINVSNYISLCMIKQGRFEEARKYIDKVLNLDKKNSMALNNIKMMKEYGIIENNFGIKVIAAALVVLLILGSSLSMLYMSRKKTANSSAGTKVQNIQNSSATQKDNSKDKTNAPATQTPAVTTPTPPAQTEKPQDTFPAEQVKKDLESSNFDNIYTDILNWKDKNISEENKALIAKGEEILKNKAIGYFYSKARELSVSGDIKTAADYYFRVYTYGKNNDFYEHGLYFLGSSKEKLGNTADALKYYEEYSNAFPKGSYEDTVLYQLANIYSSTDITKAKHFASLLREGFSDSIYNNSVIKNILSK